ncbi:hypothetical protein SAMN04488057_101168 [Cyclobacterium lianum]|uniref:Right handed beta helix region n=1 Tax=Cyclobacterium lianum TaxID=388280 RepID=A0A1M7I397_9BACT|nr:hypothetical protein [Cyclobacterium lianum]SHM35138.1 hypothetical protein SAMN04488057_101168 [Cyclobacterium lianum]
MKKSSLIAVVLLVLSGSYMGCHAGIWRVNNQLETDKSQRIFSELSPLNDDADVFPGDTIHLEGSPVRYNNFNCSKRLVIIGPGYFLTENPETQARAEEATISSIRFNPGSEGSLVMGVVFDYTSSSGIFVATNNITIQRCYMRGGVTITDQTGIRVFQNYMLGEVGGYTSSTVYSDVVVRNNLFIGGGFNTQSGSFSICENNVFTGNNITISAASFRNNIITNANANVSITSGSAQNNLAAGGQLGSENGNMAADANSLFVESGSTDGQYQLAQNSPARGAGFDGVDAGAFGGDSGYRLSGLPPIPLVYDLRVDDSGNLETGVGIQIKVKSNP